MSDAGCLVVVYQFGKVASTALVQSLNAAPDVEAHQSHFLGEDALGKMIPMTTDPNLSPYFREHIVGQFIRNLELTHQVNQTISGADSRALKVISLSREPLDWLRSCVQQDIEGYQNDILNFAEKQCSTMQQHQAIEQGLTAILSRVCELIQVKGGMRTLVAEFLEKGGKKLLIGPDLQCDEIVRKFLFLGLRPLLWFDEHFSKCFKLNLGDIPRHGNHWMSETCEATFIIIRYEDIACEFESAIRAAGIPFGGVVVQANISRDKPFAKEVRAAFESESARMLHKYLLDSDYSDYFGYSRESNFSFNCKKSNG